jgi:hypothetical protein
MDIGRVLDSMYYVELMRAVFVVEQYHLTGCYYHKLGQHTSSVGMECLLPDAFA